jgi:hypothetical protein
MATVEPNVEIAKRDIKNKDNLFKPLASYFERAAFGRTRIC